jgi:hypothetical protein
MFTLRYAGIKGMRLLASVLLIMAAFGANILIHNLLKTRAEGG